VVDRANTLDGRPGVLIPRPVPHSTGLVEREDGCRIAWYRYGAGDRVVAFFPTWNFVDARVVGHQVEYLAQRCTVITYDARGSGASDRPSSGYTFEAHVADGIAVLDELAVDHAGVVTASMGMNAAVIAQVEHPGRIDRLAAIAPYVDVAVPPDEEQEWASPELNGGRDWFSDETWRSDWPGFARFFMQACFTEPGSGALIDELVEIALDASPEALITQKRELDWGLAPSLLSKVTCPVLFIHGDSDITWPVSAVQAIAKLVPDVQLEILPGAAHRPDIQAPERVNQTLAGFLLS